MGTRPHWTYNYQIWCGGSRRRRNHWWQILSRSVKGFPVCGVRKWGSPIDLGCGPYNRSALPCCLWLLLVSSSAETEVQDGISGVQVPVQCTWLTTASQRLQTLAVLICDRPICVSFLFHGQVHATMTGVSPSVDHLSCLFHGQVTSTSYGDRSFTVCGPSKLSVPRTSTSYGDRSFTVCGPPKLSVPRTSTSYGDRSFTVCGPSTWNSLPAALWSTNVSIETFRTQLKTFLFRH